MVTFLFWNLQGRRSKHRTARAIRMKESIARLANSRKLDVLIFTECVIAPSDLLASLNGLGIGAYYQVASKSPCAIQLHGPGAAGSLSALRWCNKKWEFPQHKTRGQQG